MTANKLRTWLRIVWTIASKDIVDALRNKNAVGLIISALFVVVLYRFLPVLSSSVESPTLIIWDAGDSVLTAMLENSAVLDARVGYRSEEEMRRRLSHEDVVALGLAIPEDFDAALEAGERPELTAFAMHWVSDDDAREVRQLLEGELGALLGVTVPIRVAEERVYPWPDSGGLSVSLGMSTVYVTVMVAMLMPPNLMLEEKKARTLDALLVSPATPGHIVVGKALSGLFYALLGCLIAFAVNESVMVHWGLAAAAGVAGAIFSIAVGLLLGSLLESRQQLMLWSWVAIVPLLLPMMLYLMEDLIPGGALKVVAWLPITVMFRLVRTSFAGAIAPADWALPLAVLLGYGAAVMTAVVWVVRRTDQS